MSRVAKKPIPLPAGIDIQSQSDSVTVKGPKGQLQVAKPAAITLTIDAGLIHVGTDHSHLTAMTGTIRAIIANMIHGVSQGFQRKLELVGVGYRAAMQGKNLSLTLGYSHPLVYEAPEGISLATPSATEILVSGIDKQRVGEVAAKIRSYRPPEPYKGKGVKYADEVIVRKVAKKA